MKSALGTKKPLELEDNAGRRTNGFKLTGNDLEKSGSETAFQTYSWGCESELLPG